MINNRSADTDSAKNVTAISHIAGPVLTFIIGLILSITVYSLVRDWEKSELQILFELSARNRLAAFQSDIIRHQEVVNSIAGLFSSSENVTRREFRSFVQDALSRQSGIQGLSWNPLVRSFERKQFTEQAHQQGFTDFQIMELDANGQKSKAANRDEYVVVSYIEPYFENEQAMGFDIASHPGRMQAIQQARDSGEAVVTERIKLFQEVEEKFGYLLLRAIYRKGKTLETVAERREHFVGLAVGVFRFSDWLPTTIRSTQPVGMDILIEDLSAPVDKQFLHFHSSRTRKAVFQPTLEDLRKAEHNLHWRTTVKVLGREWSFLFMPTPVFIAEHRLWQAWTVLATGLLITLLLTLYLFAKMRHTARMASTNIELLHEITERNVNEVELRAQIDFIDTVLDAASNIIVVLDLEGRFVRFNRAAEELTGFKIAEVLGKRVWELVIPEEQRTGVETVFNHLRNGALEIASQYENEWLTRDGGRRLYHWHNSVLHDENGKISHVVAMGYDITEKKKVEIEHERLQRELQQAQKMESLGQLTGGIAHDFNNLLGIINGYASLMFDKYQHEGDQKLAGYVAHIKEAGDRAAKLVAQMLAFSRNDTVDDEPIQLEPLFNEDIKMLRATLPSSIEINTEIEAELPSILMNPIHLHQILMNLSINARDAMQEVGQLSIKLGWARGLNTVSQVSHKPVKGDWIELSVSDTGSGIDAETASNIFNPFFTTKEVGKGTGMGLSVIYGIMESHGGHILLESEPGKGSTFRMLFPPALEQSHEMRPHNQHSDKLPQGSGLEILLLDDELSLVSCMSELVMSHGYQAHFVTSSTEALALFENEPDRFSLLITDQTMPRMTGVELIKKLREIRPQIPVILCTGNRDKIDVKWAQEMDVSLFEKPIDNKQLLLKITEQLNVDN